MNKLLVLLLTIACSAFADEVLLRDGQGKLSGSLGAALADGTIVWKVGPSSSEARIRPGQVTELRFKEQAGQDKAPLLIELRSGDAIPAALTRLSAGDVALSVPTLGEMKVPRDLLASFRAASAKDKVLYAGVKGGEEWEVVGGDTDSVEIGLGGIKTRGRESVEVRSNTKLPRNFRIRATFRWDQQTMPRFVLSFADPFAEQGRNTDRYFLQFVNVGMEVKRQSSTRRMYSTVGRAAIGNEIHTLRKVTVDISVTRDNGAVLLVVDGKEAGRWVDPVVANRVGKAPQGDGWGIAFGTPGGISEVCDISVSDLGAGGKLAGADDGKGQDVLINAAGEKLSGKLVGAEGVADDLCLLLESAFQNEPLRIKAKEVLLVSFAGKPLGKAQGPVIVSLVGQGVLHVSSAAFDGTAWNLEHPLLGRLKAPAAAVTSVEWTEKAGQEKNEETKKP